MAMQFYQILLSYKCITYTENGNSLKLQTELMTGGKTVVYIPNDERRTNTFAIWARRRKEEILENIINELKIKYEIKYYVYEEY
jgi:hypothetical protein